MVGLRFRHFRCVAASMRVLHRNVLDGWSRARLFALRR
jgi:hypothetical protein